MFVFTFLLSRFVCKSITEIIKKLNSLCGFWGRCLNIRDVCMDFKPCFKVYNLVSIFPKSIKLGQMISLNVIFYVLLSLKRLAKIWNSLQFHAQFWNSLKLHTISYQRQGRRCLYQLGNDVLDFLCHCTINTKTTALIKAWLVVPGRYRYSTCWTAFRALTLLQFSGIVKPVKCLEHIHKSADPNIVAQVSSAARTSG